MSTFRQLCLRVIAESGLEKEPVDNVISPEYVFNWLKPVYQKAIDSMPFGAIVQAQPLFGTTVAPVTGGAVNVTKGSATVQGVGTSFDGGMVTNPHKLFRTSQDGFYYAITAANVGLQQLTLATAYVGETATEITAQVVTPYYLVPNIRWITQLVRSDYGELEHLHPTKLSDLDPYRTMLPGPPTVFAKRLIEPTTGQRYIELYPYPDAVYHMTAFGYGNLDEPVITGSPHAEIDEELIVCGGKAYAYDYRSQLAASRNEIDKSTAFLRLASSEGAKFREYIKQISNRDNNDQEPPRVRVRMTHSQYLFGPVRDPIIDAYSHVWNRP